MATARALINKALLRLSDPSGVRWGDSTFCLPALNDGVDDYARRTKSFRKLVPLATGQDPDLFECPSDMHEPYIVEYNNRVLRPSSWRELADMDPEFTTRQGTPTHWYRDLSDVTQIRVWPVPDDNEEDIAQILVPDPSGYAYSNDTGSDEGGVCYATFDGVDATFSQEEGSVVYIEDSTGARTFEFAGSNVDAFGNPSGEINPGEIVACFASVLRVGYAYTPQPVDMNTEIRLPDQQEIALVYWLVAACYEKDGDTRDLKKAAYWLEKYEGVVAEAKRRADDGYMARPHETEGVWL